MKGNLNERSNKMENTVNTVVEATNAVNEIGFTMPDSRELAIFGAGVAATIVVEKVVIPTAKKVVVKFRDKFGKKKPIETTAEVVEIEE